MATSYHIEQTALEVKKIAEIISILSCLLMDMEVIQINQLSLGKLLFGEAGSNWNGGTYPISTESGYLSLLN